MFTEVPTDIDFPAQERETLKFWADADIERKCNKLRSGAEPFVFYEGPPTANGLPHPGHVLTRVMKDLYPRYQTMRGRDCLRKGGWDTHGLPVEVEVCKELGIHSKAEIEAYGIEPFVHRCIESVFRYTREWEDLTRRIGFWIDLENAYVTYHQSYVESVWWALKTLFDRGLLYQGHKIVWWWAQGGTALSAGEVGEGYRTVDDPSVYVRFPVVDEPDLSLLVWTTTPWTLLSNLYVAVNNDIDYAVVRDAESGQRLIMAAELVEPIAAKVKREFTVEETRRGSDLVGARYVPPFDYFHKEYGDRQYALKDGGTEHGYWRVLPGDFVTIDAGSGLVHEAPAYGEVDFDLFQDYRQRLKNPDELELLHLVAPDGTFVERTGPYAGRWVKDCDKDIARELRDRGLLFHLEQVRHEYPFCPRAEDDPLIQYPRQGWFIRTTAFKDKMLANNEAINWMPEHIKKGRFGKFLESNVDWALSRERFWGTPLPIWQCEKTGHQEAIGRYDELLAKPGLAGTEAWKNARRKNPDLPEDLRIHKPYIDEMTYQSPKDPSARMRRVTEVIDCWFDSGAMPFAQWGYPHRGREMFERQFPADFISEAIDQTRGWFYSLLAISTLLFDENHAEGTTPPTFPHPYRNCVVLGLILGHDGLKLSKRKRNYDEPAMILDREGADALRWYFYSSQAPWTSARFDESAIRTAQREFSIRLYNVYSFFVIYANIDRFEPLPNRPDVNYSELDRWVLSELHRTIREVRERLDAYDNFAAARSLIDFVDGLSNWYVRRSRDRFWGAGMNDQKMAAYQTLWECLRTTALLIAPFTPFMAESMYRNLVSGVLPDHPESVHLCDFPEPDAARIDETLSTEMALVRQIVSLGRSARTAAKIKVRQPLEQVEIVLASTGAPAERRAHEEWLGTHAGLICDELNVKNVAFTDRADQYVEYQVKPNFRNIGPKFGKFAPGIKKALAAGDPPAMRAELVRDGCLTLDVEGNRLQLSPDDVQVELFAKPGWTAAQGREAVVILSIEITPQLRAEGTARELIHHIQQLRKEAGLEYTDRIDVEVDGPDHVATVCRDFAELICRETLAKNLTMSAGATGKEFSLDGERIVVAIRKIR